jgi:hypothetical protein
MALHYHNCFFTNLFIARIGPAEFKDILKGSYTYLGGVLRIPTCDSKPKLLIHPLRLLFEHTSGFFTKRNIISRITPHFTTLDIIANTSLLTKGT